MENQPEQEVSQQAEVQNRPLFKTGAMNPYLKDVDIVSMVGRQASELKEELKAQQRTFRVMKEDGKSFIGIMNYNPGRINLEIENGIVTRSYGG
jgi:hypothetical protein